MVHVLHKVINRHMITKLVPELACDQQESDAHILFLATYISEIE